MFFCSPSSNNPHFLMPNSLIIDSSPTFSVTSSFIIMCYSIRVDFDFDRWQLPLSMELKRRPREAAFLIG